MILRTRFEDGYQVNQYLGDSYHLVDRVECPEKFTEFAKHEFGDKQAYLLSEAYAFIVYRDGAVTEPLYKGHQHLILNDRGEVFANLSFR